MCHLGEGRPQQHLRLLLGAHPSLRVSEMFNLRLAGDERYVIVDDKGGKRQSVPVSTTP